MSNGEDQIDTVSKFPEPLIYVGPNSTKLGLMHMNVYAELHDLAAETREQFPALNALFISLSDFPAIRDQVIGAEKGSISHVVDYLNSQGIL